MIAIERILVPHDFTDHGRAAHDRARGLATVFGATCAVLHVIERAGTDAADEPPDPASAAVQFRHGVPHEEIVRCAREQAADLIVMGTHGRRGVAHLLLGSVAEKVVRTAPCPVLTIRQRRPDRTANVLVATDFGVAAQVALDYGRTLAHLFGARLHLLHVVENNFLRPIASDTHALMTSAREQLAAQLTADDRSALQAIESIETSDHPADAIVDYARNADIDLIVMGTHGRHAFDRLLLGSVAEQVVRTAPCEVLTVRRSTEESVAASAAAHAADRGGIRR
jgi:nucleotide-binding universal stress UspA family protein